MLFFNDFYEDIPTLMEQAGIYMRYFKEEDEVKEQLLADAEKIYESVEELDARINQVAQGWTTKRMSRVDLTIIRLALYEILYEEDVPDKVAINEAVELAKVYGGDNSPGFVNAILGKLVRAK